MSTRVGHQTVLTPDLTIPEVVIPTIPTKGSDSPRVKASIAAGWQLDGTRVRTSNRNRLCAKRRTHRFSKQAMRGLTPADQQIFERFGQGPIVDLPYTRIHHAFEVRATANPHAVAAQHLGQSITYGELDAQANRLARILADHGVSNGDAVALFLHRSIPMLVGILATLKVGAAYVPQHVGVAPETQLRHIIDAASTRVILTLASLRDLVPVPDDHVCIAIDDVMQQPLSGITPYVPAGEIGRDDRCFILFTSGTTGNPNGVQVTHGNVCNILLTAPGNLGMRPGLKVAQILSIAFDMAAWETLGCLANGATLIIRGKSIAEAVEQADIVIATPSVLGTLDPDRCRNIKVAAVAGEPCPRPLAEKWTAFCTFYNSCGPTETTIVNTMQRFHPTAERLTIGKPTPNNTVYILDEHMKPCAIGEVGEMWAGGDCVSAGYLDNPELNRERYAPDPFLGGGRMMFRTRDLGRWTPDGELEHLGRTDDQVKIRGFRVELDSVSAILESTAGCKQAVTLKLDSRTLVAFVRPATVDVDAARQAVADALPYYCTPEQVIALDEFPMTSRGKVDKRTLLRLVADQPEAQPAWSQTPGPADSPAWPAAIPALSPAYPPLFTGTASAG
ncbi:MAG: amino acid adenylation domain-containing protein [Caldilinea sp.]|nr:amino acid adenylation domain-containing protein [Caldilinea sp.]